jgi:guanylate kinase
MALEWVKENWEHVIKMEQMNKGGKELLSMISYAETLQRMGEDAAPEISKVIDKEILENSKTLFTSENRQVMIDAEAVLSHILTSEIEKTANHKRIILVGKAASGKDHARKLLENQGFKYAVSYTTRPPRTGEENGKDYFFLSVEEFTKMVENNEFYEHVSFNTWQYGTSNSQFFSDDVFIMTPYGISKIHEDDRKRCFIIYFDMDESIRKERLSLRSDADTVERRLAADAADFENFTDFDIKITNPNF